MAPLEKLLLSPKEAAEVLGCGTTRLYELLNSGEIHSITHGRSRRIPRDALIAYVERISKVPPEPMARWA